MMKTALLMSTLSFLVMNEGFASATVELKVHQENGELKVVNDKTKAGFIEYGGKNYWIVKYSADPGVYTVTGKNPKCPPVVQSSTFEEGKSYHLILTKDCRIENVIF